MITISRTIVRLLPQGIVAEIGPEGVAIRRRRGKKRWRFTWEQIASLASTGPEEALIRAAEQAGGQRHIRAMLMKEKTKLGTS